MSPGAPLAFTLMVSLTAPALAVAEAPRTPPLPDPLTLEHALDFADREHPDLQLADSGIEQARARLLQAQARTGIYSHVDLRPQRADPSLGGGPLSDNWARFLLGAQLYDFGRSSAERSAAQAGIASRVLAYFDTRQSRRMEIMARFFDVLLADLRYAVDNEDMAHKYVNYDKVRERHGLGQVSDVDLLASENEYREALIRRTESQKQLTSTRLALALALNQSEQLPNELVNPRLEGLERDIPEYRELYRAVLEANPALRSLRQDVEAARAQLDAERARRRPTLSAELEATDYQQVRSGRDDWRATLNLRIPLYQGGEDEAAVARAAAELDAREALLRKAEHGLQKTVLDLVQELETLKVRRDAARQRLAFRELALDRARAIYELEVQTTLGDALTRVTEAQWQAAKVEFELALAWAKVDALSGRLLPSQTKEKRP